MSIIFWVNEIKIDSPQFLFLIIDRNNFSFYVTLPQETGASCQ